MTLENFLTTLPKGWYWSIDCLALKGKVPYINEKGKEKWRPVPYTVYVSNGIMFVERFYASAFVDCDNFVEGLVKAVEIVKQKELDLREEFKKEQERKKRK